MLGVGGWLGLTVIIMQFSVQIGLNWNWAWQQSQTCTSLLFPINHQILVIVSPFSSFHIWWKEINLEKWYLRVILSSYKFWYLVAVPLTIYIRSGAFSIFTINAMDYWVVLKRHVKGDWGKNGGCLNRKYPWAHPRRNQWTVDGVRVSTYCNHVVIF